MANIKMQSAVLGGRNNIFKIDKKIKFTACLLNQKAKK